MEKANGLNSIPPDYMNDFFKTLTLLKNHFEVTLPAQYKVLNDELAKVGWHLDYDMAPKTVSEIFLLDLKECSYLNDFMVKYYRNSWKTIANSIQKLYPERRNFIELAFTSHKRKEYELSIPAFIIQSEGICYDLTDKDLFSIGPMSEKRKEQPKHWVQEQQLPAFKSSFLEPLANNKYSSQQIKNRNIYPHSLNRNEILHGRSLTYPTELNSYKAISLLNYIAIVVADIKFNRPITWR